MCEGLATLHTCIPLGYNVNCVISNITGKGESILPLLTLIVFLSSFMIFKTGICECSIIFGMTIVLIYTMSSFRCMKCHWKLLISIAFLFSLSTFTSFKGSGACEQFSPIGYI
jgi:hypothetical protein